MNNFLRKINLIEDIHFILSISKTDFIQKFKENVENSNLGIDIFEGFEAFSSNEKIYKGNITDRKFEIKRRIKLFETNQTNAIAKGNFKEINNRLHFAVEINGFKKSMFFFLALIFLFYGIFLSNFIFVKTEFPSIILPIMLAHALFMLGIPYFIMKKSVKKMQYDLKRDFHYWIVKQ